MVKWGTNSSKYGIKREHFFSLFNLLNTREQTQRAWDALLASNSIEIEGTSFCCPIRSWLILNSINFRSFFSLSLNQDFIYIFGFGWSKKTVKSNFMSNIICHKNNSNLKFAMEKWVYFIVLIEEWEKGKILLFFISPTLH